MGFLSRLFGKLNGQLQDELSQAVQKGTYELDETVNGWGETARKAKTRAKKNLSGFSWGAEMPEEENQYNFPGSYEAYFEKVFTEDFPDYRLEKVQPLSGKGLVMNLWDGEVKALVVELLSKSSDSQRLRRDCQKQRIPYLRFYYDYHGWWNTRAYVKHRAEEALRGRNSRK